MQLRIGSAIGVLIKCKGSAKIVGGGGCYRVFIIYCVFFKNFKIFRTLTFLCFPSASACVRTKGAGRKPALQQNWQSSGKSQNCMEKHNI